MTATTLDIRPDRQAVPGSTWAYARISFDRTGAGLGVERQFSEMTDLAAQLGLPGPLVRRHDNDTSAWSGKKRPGYLELLVAMRDGRCTDLLIWHVDRLTRQPRDLQTIVDIVTEHGVRVHAVKGGRIDLESGEGLLQARIFGDLAEYESRHRSDRVKSKAAERAEQGLPQGGTRPYGYASGGMDVVPREAAVVAELTDRVIAGETCRSLAADLRTRGELAARGGQWTGTGIRDLLRRPRNAGLRETGGTRTRRGRLVPAAWPALVDAAKWEACCGILDDPGRTTSHSNAPKTLLSGIAVCHLGHKMVSGGSRSGRRTYVCDDGAGTRGHLTRKADPVDEMVITALVGLDVPQDDGTVIHRPGLLAHHGLGVQDGESSDPSPVILRQQADGLRKRLSGFVQDYADGLMPRDDYRTNAARLQAQIDELDRKAAVHTVPTALDGLEDATADDFGPEGRLPLDRQRTIVRTLLTVTLHPARPMGRIFDVDSVQIAARTP